MFPLEIRINFVKIVKNRWFSSVSSEDFKRIILILVLNDRLKNSRTKCENRMEKYWLVRKLWAIKVVDLFSFNYFVFYCYNIIKKNITREREKIHDFLFIRMKEFRIIILLRVFMWIQIKKSSNYANILNFFYLFHNI